MAIHCYSHGRRRSRAKAMMPRFSIQLAGSRGAFVTLKGTHVLSKPKWTSSSQERSWLCKLATTKIGHAVFIACLRKQLVVLPLDQSIGEQQRDAALEICRASAVVSAGPQRKFSADHSAEDSRHNSRLGRKCALALETYLGHNGSTARNSISQPSVAGRLQSDLRHDGHFR